MNTLEICIGAAGGLHWAIAAMNLALPSKLRYRENLARLSPIVRQVFIVHSAYIVLVLLGLGALCLFFAGELASGSLLGRSLCGFLAFFWLLRSAIQLLCLDREVKRQNPAVNALMLILTTGLGGLFAALAGGVAS